MAVRTIKQDLLAVRTYGSSDVDTTPYQLAAHQVVERLVTPKGATESELKTVETWLACHFWEVVEPRASEVTTPDSTIILAMSDLGDGLRSTHFGQQAIVLDPTGELGRAAGAKRPQFEVI